MIKDWEDDKFNKNDKRFVKMISSIKLIKSITLIKSIIYKFFPQ